MTEEQFGVCCERIRQGDKDGLKEIYEAYISYIYAVILRVLGNRENAEDVTADFFIRLWELADRYRQGRGHRAWMSTIARNMAIDFLRAHKREQLTEEIPDVAAGDAEVVSTSGRSHGQPGSDVENAVVGDMAISQALEQLSDAERQVVHMKIMGDMTFQEISNVLGIPMGTVTWRYQNALKKLRRCGYE